MSALIIDHVLKSFIQPFIQALIKENIKAPRHWPLCREFTGDRWISPHKGPVTRKMFPFDDVIRHREGCPRIERPLISSICPGGRCLTFLDARQSGRYSVHGMFKCIPLNDNVAFWQSVCLWLNIHVIFFSTIMVFILKKLPDKFMHQHHVNADSISHWIRHFSQKWPPFVIFTYTKTHANSVSASSLLPRLKNGHYFLHAQNCW